ncbi:hypothetical protein GOBAR_DD28482 [Gossypium barbadense]|nr:hypothetical protein GOBAR_DD28482 [Gossypium barbadense]
MAKGLEVVEMGWYLSLKAQSRRATTMNSVWLREEGKGWFEVSVGYARELFNDTRSFEYGSRLRRMRYKR